jgi:outer membrane protein assembly factor BamB
MTVKKVLEYKLKGERNITSRKPLIIGNRIFVPYIFDKKDFVASKLICLDKDTFDFYWEYYYPFVINNLVFKNENSLLVCCMDGQLIELNPNTGDEISIYNLEMDRCGMSSKIEDNQIVVGGIQRTTLTNCFDLSSKSIKWSINNGGHSYIPLIKNGKVYQCTDNTMRCLELNSGKMIWKANEKKSFIFNPILFQEMIVVGGYGFVNFYNCNNGQLLHKIRAAFKKDIYSIIADHDTIYFGVNTSLFYAFRITSKKNWLGRIKINSEKLWTFKLNGSQSIAVIDGNSNMVINDDYKLISLNKSNGAEKWNFNTKGKTVVSGILIDGDDMYISAEKGYLYKLNKNN